MERSRQWSKKNLWHEDIHKRDKNKTGRWITNKTDWKENIFFNKIKKKFYIIIKLLIKIIF